MSFTSSQDSVSYGCGRSAMFVQRCSQTKPPSYFKDQYELLELLGRGPFSTVRRCVQKDSGKSFAVKIVQVGLLKQNPVNSDILQAIRIETRICSLLKHPHIVQLIETFEDEETLYMVFELIQGADICSEIVTRAKSGFVYSEAVTSHYFRQLLEAIAYCHKLHIVHRDLKPHCVLLCENSDGTAPVKLGGFGSATIISNEYVTNNDINLTMSTRPYAAPEVVSNKRFDFSADSWSLGVILHLLLTGCLPCFDVEKFREGESITIVRDGSKLFSDISDASKDLLKGLLDYDPCKRLLPDAALDHSWIKERILFTPKLHLSETVDQLIKFNRRRKLKAAILSATEMRDDVLNLNFEEVNMLNQAISIVTNSLDDMQYLENPDICPTRFYEQLTSNHTFCSILSYFFEIYRYKECFCKIDANKLGCAEQMITNAFEHCFKQGVDADTSNKLRKTHNNVKALLEIMQSITNLGNLSRNREFIENAAHDSSFKTRSAPDMKMTENSLTNGEHGSKHLSRSSTLGYGLRLVQFQRRNDEPMGIAVKVTDDKRCVISRIIHGGLIHRQGILQVGDEIREINGSPVATCKLNLIQEKLLNARGNVSFKIVPTNRLQSNSIPCEMYVKALFNYDPIYDESNPCPRVGIKFEVGDLLKILSKDDYNWWQARKYLSPGETTSGGDSIIDSEAGAGLIPSPELQEWRIASETSDDCTLEQKKPDGNCGMFIRRRKYKDKYLTKLNAIFQQLDLPTYEEVVSVENYRWKTIVLLGAHGVGRRHLKNTLISNEPERYSYPIPHTTKLMPSSEENGKNYWFVTADEMLADIANNAYLEYGIHEHAMYGTKLDTIRSIIKKSGRMAVLDVEPQAIKVLRTAEFAPIIVFIAAPVLSDIRCIREASDDDCLERLVQESDLLQRTYAHLFDISIVNMDIDETVTKLRDILERKFYTGTQWVPAKWIY